MYRTAQRQAGELAHIKGTLKQVNIRARHPKAGRRCRQDVKPPLRIKPKHTPQRPFGGFKTDITKLGIRDISEYS